MRRNDDFSLAPRSRNRGDWGLSRWGEGDFFSPASFFTVGSPWQMMRRMQEEMDRTFGQFAPFFGSSIAPEFGGLAGMQQWAPSVDVSESDREWRVEVDLPGVKQDQIDVELRDHHLVLRAEMHEMQQEEETPPQQSEQQGAQAQQGQPQQQQRRYHHRERRFGYFERVLPLPENADEENIRCEFRDGVLTCHIPKTEQSRTQGRRIAIGGGETTAATAAQPAVNAGSASGQQNWSTGQAAQRPAKGEGASSPGEVHSENGQKPATRSRKRSKSTA